MNDQRSILIVDDNELQRNATEALFVVEGYTVKTASDPVQAMEILRSDEDLSLALFDIKLGTEKKGLQLVQDARYQRPTLRIIVYTGGEPELGSEALRRGATFFIQKSRSEDLVLIAGSVAEMWKLERTLETHRLKSEEMQRIFDAVGTELLVRDSEGKIILVNQTKRKTWAKRHPESDYHDCIGKVCSPDDDSKTGVSYQPQSGGDFHKTREQKTAGYTLLIETRPLHSDDGRVIGCIEAAIDISRRQRILDFAHELETMFSTATKQQIGQKLVEQVHDFTGGRARLYLMCGEVLTGFCCAGMEPDIQFAGHRLAQQDAQAEKAFAELYPSTLSLDGTVSDPSGRLLRIDAATEKLFLPLMQRGKRLGIIVVDNQPCPSRKFTKEDLDLLALFRPCVEAALTNADRREHAKSSEMWLRAISEVDEALLSTNHFEEIQEKVMKEVDSMLGADTTSLVFGEGPHSLREVVRLNEKVLKHGGEDFPALANGPLDWVFKSRKPLKVEADLWNDIRFKALREFQPANLPPNAERFQAALLCPLEIRGRIWAVAVFWFRVPISLPAHHQFYLNIMLQRISMAKARINDYCEMERVAMERAKESSVGLLASAYNHHFRNSIQGLLNKARLLERKIGAAHKPAASEMVGDVLSVARRIESLRSWVKLDESQTPEIELIGTLKEIEELVSDVAGPAGITIQMNLPEPPVFVEGGGGALKIGILDIFQNSVKFMPAGGVVLAKLAVDDNTATLTISDRGPGLPPEVLAAINEPKALTAGNTGPSPFGIGLYLALKAVARVKGTILASNLEEGGAQFEIRMPITSQGKQS